MSCTSSDNLSHQGIVAVSQSDWKNTNGKISREQHILIGMLKADFHLNCPVIWGLDDQFVGLSVYQVLIGLFKKKKNPKNRNSNSETNKLQVFFGAAL